MGAGVMGRKPIAHLSGNAHILSPTKESVSVGCLILDKPRQNRIMSG